MFREGLYRKRDKVFAVTEEGAFRPLPTDLEALQAFPEGHYVPMVLPKITSLDKCRVGVYREYIILYKELKTLVRGQVCKSNNEEVARILDCWMQPFELIHTLAADKLPPASVFSFREAPHITTVGIFESLLYFTDTHVCLTLQTDVPEDVAVGFRGIQEHYPPTKASISLVTRGNQLFLVAENAKREVIAVYPAEEARVPNVKRVMPSKEALEKAYYEVYFSTEFGKKLLKVVSFKNDANRLYLNFTESDYWITERGEEVALSPRAVEALYGTFTCRDKEEVEVYGTEGGKAPKAVVIGDPYRFLCAIVEIYSPMKDGAFLLVPKPSRSEGSVVVDYPLEIVLRPGVRAIFMPIGADVNDMKRK